MTSPAKDAIEEIDLPLYLPYCGMSTDSSIEIGVSGGAQYIKNGIPTSYENKFTGKKEIHIKNRIGYKVRDSYSGSGYTTEDLGIFYWDKTGRVYSVFSDTLAYSTLGSGTATNLTTSYTASTDNNYAHFTEYFDGTNNYLATRKSNYGSKAYIIDTSNTLTEITDGDFPSSLAVGAFVSLDGYLFTTTITGKIYNSDLGLPLSWTSTNFISSSMYPDDGVTLAKYKNKIVTFGTNSVEFFYNAANPTGSPLAREEQYSISGIGCIDPKTVIELNNTIYWINGFTGSPGVYRLDNYKAEKVSNEYLDKYISMNSNSSYLFYSGKITILGVECYYMGIKGYPTFIYNPELDLWMVWTTEAFGTQYAFGTRSSSILPSTVYPYGGQTYFASTLGDTIRDIIYYDNDNTINSPSISGDENSSSIPVTFQLRTKALDFGTTNKIRIHKIILRLVLRGSTYPVTYTLNNLGIFKNPTIIISRLTPDTALTISVNDGTAKTIGSSIPSAAPTNGLFTITGAKIQYSICEQ